MEYSLNPSTLSINLHDYFLSYHLHDILGIEHKSNPSILSTNIGNHFLSNRCHGILSSAHPSSSSSLLINIGYITGGIAVRPRDPFHRNRKCNLQHMQCFKMVTTVHVLRWDLFKTGPRFASARRCLHCLLRRF